ncbi:cytosine deaminase [Martelella mediterranea]|uniref:Cytosine deaminase n=1 Tax=Martelella mediterranea TaxID=293089 RepID=A0A4R3NXS0_9HYPH|nr:cytosine deaminase [Martelella mediterranea]TCT45057.1 cytosine deaminase [Martelella mediterranea]
MIPFVKLPEAPHFALTKATVPAVCIAEIPNLDVREGLVSVDITVRDGRISDILPAGHAPKDMPHADMRDGMIWPTFCDMHTHIDKGHIWERRRNPDGTFMGALENVMADRQANWSADDVAARMEFSLKTAYAHGTALLRTHLDSLPPQHEISFEVFDDIREKWANKIELQAVALFATDQIFEPFFDDLLAILRKHNGLLGGVTQPGPDLVPQLDRLFSAATENDLNIDLHVDETGDPSVLTLKDIAEAKLRLGFEGAVTVGHCCSLAVQDEETAKRTIDLVARAEISVVSLPMCNMYLQGREAGRTPRWRGVTLLKELAAAGVKTAVASDNTRDPFYAYGDLDPVEVIREAVRILQLDHPLDDAARVMTRSPADILGRPERGLIKKGGPGDLVLFSARRWSEFLSRPQADRIVMRNGMGIDRSLPDYRELDPLMEK